MRLATLVLLLTSATAVQAQWLDLPTPGIPRTADGKPHLAAPAPRAADGRPELTGLWRPVGTSGDLRDATKIQAWARTRMAEHERTFYKEGPQFLCLPSGPGFVAGGGGLRRLVQSPTMIAVLNGDLTYRQIFIDGRALEPDPLPIFMGYSVGRWDGDTLIIESNGFNEKTWLRRRVAAHREAAHHGALPAARLRAHAARRHVRGSRHVRRAAARRREDGIRGGRRDPRECVQ
jgi:hypothetical protein